MYFVQYLEFIFPYTQTQHTTLTGSFIRWGIKDSSLVTTTGVITKMIWQFCNLWLVHTKDFTSLSRKYFTSYPWNQTSDLLH